MKLLNATRMQANYAMGMEPSGRELLVVVVKGTFQLPRPGEQVALAAEQTPLVDSDLFTGEPGFSAPLYESDYAPFKPRCDVLLNGSAYAPGGRQARRVTVSLRFGSLSKSFHVVGDRYWIGAGLGRGLAVVRNPSPCCPSPTTAHSAASTLRIPIPRAMSITTGTMLVLVFTARPNENSSTVPLCPIPKKSMFLLPIRADPISPCLSAPSRARGCRGSNSQGPTIRTGSTISFHFLPPDFDNRYYQAAPPDQQIDYPQGGEEVILENLTPSGTLAFNLPSVKVPVRYYPRGEDDREVQAVIDTIMIEPDLGRFAVSWRSSLALKRNMFEVEQVLVGEMPRSWHRARELGKTYYPSLGALVASKKGTD